MRIEIKKLFSLKRVTAFVGLVSIIVLTAGGFVSAQTVTQGYSSDRVLQRGTVVSLDAEDTSKVVAANKENEDQLHGIVVAPNDSNLTLSDVEEKTFVATIGRYDGFVSTEAGPIQAGDFLTVSNISGLAMKAGEKDKYTIGKAIESFDGQNGAISSTEITNALGETSTVGIGRILIDVGVGFNPLLKPAESSLPEFLEQATETIAGKPVSPVRVYIGLFIILSAAAIAGSLLYSGVRSSVISVGRNPLSKKSITKSLIQIVLTAIIIFLIGLFGVYLLLRL